MHIKGCPKRAAFLCILIKKGYGSIKAIFLDVDGVLAYEEYRNRETANIDLEKVQLLKEICDSTDASVVISSSWRGIPGYVPDCYYTLISILQVNGIRVLGNIPNLNSSNENHRLSFTLDELETMETEEGSTAAEIQAWLGEHPEVSNFLILDDLDLHWKEYEYDTHWIQPTWFGNGGLKREHVEQAIRILVDQIISN